MTSHAAAGTGVQRGPGLHRVRQGGKGGAHEEGIKEGTEGRNGNRETVQKKAMGLYLAGFKGDGGDGVADGESLHLEGVEGQESLDCLE